MTPTKRYHSRYFPIDPFGDIPVSRIKRLTSLPVRSVKIEYPLWPPSATETAFLAKFRGFLEIKGQTVLVEFESSAISAVHLAPDPIRSQSQKRE